MRTVKSLAISSLKLTSSKHDSYGVDEELIRMMQVSSSFKYNEQTPSIHWIRYNPNEYYVDGTRASSDYKVAKEQLLKSIANEAFKKPISISYLYYDINDGLPAIFKDPKYPDHVKEYVVDVVYQQ
ncbi:hypothetical protein Unana1_05971 [Umbelopsis nana]